MNFEDARRIMVESQLRPNRVTSEAVLAAMGSLPREMFVPEALRPIAYVDEDLEIAPGRCIMAPLTLARLVQAAAPEAPAGGKDGAEETAPTLLMILRERPGLDLAGKKALDMAAEARREAMVSALARSARLAAPEGPDFATMFVEETAPALAAARRFGLGFELPEPEAPRATGPSAPGMDPARPPKLR